MAKTKKHVLTVVKKELLPESTNIIQTDDGTLYYCKYTPPVRLYVQWQGKEIEATLPVESIDSHGSQGKVVYFTSQQKMYKAVFSPSDGITISYLRELAEGENHHRGAISSIMKAGKRYVCPMWEEPKKHGVVKDLSEEELKGLRWRGVHRSKDLFVLRNKKMSEPTGHKYGENAIIIESSIESPVQLHAEDSSQFIHVHFKSNELHILNTKTAEFRPTVQFDANLRIVSIAGVFNGKISLKCLIDKELCVVTAKLPVGYFGNTWSADDELKITRRFGEEKQLEIPNGFDSRFIKDFEVTRILGSGGFGVVFEVVHKLSNWKYAVKRVSVEKGREEAANKEIKTTVKLSYHTGIVRYDYAWKEVPPPDWQSNADSILLNNIGYSKDIYALTLPKFTSFLYILMESCNYSLEYWLNTHRDESSRHLPRIKSSFKQIVAAVAYIHQMDFIHRDLKPANILFFAEGWLKVCDMGISAVRSIDGKTDFTRTSIGSKMYMSPEQ
ncbi:hypothetical protein PMAYCL1PPCAC_09477, partial [Pristionchus mayeri]